MTCHYCGTPLPKIRRTRDHVVPRAFGGANLAWNIVRACNPCNAAKADRIPAVRHLAECEHCRSAVARWEAGERVPVLRQGSPENWPQMPSWGQPEPAEPEPIRPDLAPLSPGMRAYLLDRERRAARHTPEVARGTLPPGWPDESWSSRKES